MNKQNASTKRRPAKPDNGKPQTQPLVPAETSNTPVARINMWPVSASIWQGFSAQGHPYYSVSFQRTYKDADDKWQYSDIFFPNDLLLVSEAARAAFHRIAALRAAERPVKPAPRPQQNYQGQDEDVPF